MRRNQLSCTIESFKDQAKNNYNHKLSFYIDGNNIHEVMKDMLSILNYVYDKETPFDEFIDKIKNFDGRRFGRTECKRYDRNKKDWFNGTYNYKEDIIKEMKENGININH